jgi:hypothetical protein
MCISSNTVHRKCRVQLLIEFELSPSFGGECVLTSVDFGKAAITS